MREGGEEEGVEEGEGREGGRRGEVERSKTREEMVVTRQSQHLNLFLERVERRRRGEEVKGEEVKGDDFLFTNL